MNYNKKDIDQFFKGKLSKKKAKDFLKWLETPAGTATYNTIIEEVWDNASGNTETPPEKADPHLEVMADNEKIPDFKTSKSKSIPTKKPYIKTWLNIAATLLFVFSFSFAFYFNIPAKKIEEPSPTADVFAIIKSTPKGIKKRIKLPDGSTVTLNAESKMTYGDDFIQNRILELEGEAFFEVAKDEKHPFIVKTNNIATTALGTSFNIKAYSENPDIQVTLATGKVKVENSLINKQIEIQPGEAVLYSGKDKSFESKHVDVTKALSWKEGILQFEKVPFDEIIQDLERWYAVDIQVKGNKKIPEHKCSGTFNQNEYLSNVLLALSYSVEFEYTINGKNVTIDFK